jgi:hypothetical protein
MHTCEMFIHLEGRICGEPATYSMFSTRYIGTADQTQNNYWLCAKCYQIASSWKKFSYCDRTGLFKSCGITKEEF